MMNSFEKLALEKATGSSMQFTGAALYLSHPGTSRLVIERMLEDIGNKYPDLDLKNLHRLAELANSFAIDDGLLVTPNLELPLTPAYEQLSFQIALTTIWIAQFTGEISDGKRKTRIEKRKRDFQVCLLVYFFNQIIGRPPLLLGKKVENKTIGKYGMNRWYFDESEDHEQEKLRIFFDVLHMCALEYRNP